MTWVLPGVAVTVPFVGAVESRMMVSKDGEGVVLPHWSLNHTLTVFVPLPVLRIQLFVAAKALNVVQVAVLLTHILFTPLLAVSVNVTDVFLVATAPLFMVIVPVGGPASFIVF